MKARWTFFLMALLSLVIACQRTRRCATCGMKIYPARPGSPTFRLRAKSWRSIPRAAPRGMACGSGARARRSLSRLLFARAQRHWRASLRARIRRTLAHGTRLVPVALANAERFARDQTARRPRAPDIFARVCRDRFAERIAAVKERIRLAAERTGRSPESIRLVAVSKRHPADAVKEAYRLGLRAFGENYAQSSSQSRRRRNLAGQSSGT